MNKPQKKESVNSPDYSPFLKGIQSELKDIKNLILEQVSVNLVYDRQTLNTLIKGKENNNAKKK